MTTRTMEFSASQVRDFNTTTAGSTTTITANGNVPERLLVGSGGSDPTHSNILNTGDITNYRATFQVDADNEVVPASTVGIEYSTDDGATWSNFYEDSNLEEEGYLEYQVYLDGGTSADGPDAGDEWISIVSFPDPDSSNTDYAGTGFMLADMDIADGDTFTTSDVPNANSEFTVCFTTGMRIETANGPVAVEDLQLGDMVKTLDNGLQPLRFMYRRAVASKGTMRPIVFEKNALGTNERFVVSQRHRIHLSMLEKVEPSAAKVDGLIEACHLINGTTIRVCNDLDSVEYFHLMFDKHELIWSEGVLSESWQPHRRNLRRDKALRKELFAIFPEIAQRNGSVDPSPVRKTFEFNAANRQRHS